MVKNNNVVNGNKDKKIIRGILSRRTIREKLNSYKCQINTTPMFTEGYIKVNSPRWIEINAKIELCKELLGIQKDYK